MSTAINSNLIKTICDGLAIDGYAVFDEAFPAAVIIALQELIKGQAVAQFSPAGLGRTTGFHTNLKIRSDEIMWIDKSRIENLSYYDWSEALRMALNEQFYL